MVFVYIYNECCYSETVYDQSMNYFGDWLNLYIIIDDHTLLIQLRMKNYRFISVIGSQPNERKLEHLNLNKKQTLLLYEQRTKVLYTTFRFFYKQ